MAGFKRATRSRVYLKLAITGASGSGKTYSALRLASGISDKIALIDTENGSASLYADRFNFDTLDIAPPFNDFKKFIDAIKMAEKAGYDVVIIDSASHFWEGILDFKSKLDARGGNSYTNWNEAGNKFKDILAAVLQSPMHVIACMRSKIDYVLEANERGKQTPRKVGLAPIMRDGIEYEFTTVFDVDMSHQAAASKDRTGLFVDKIEQITEDTGRRLMEWRNSAKGSVLEPQKPAQSAPADTVDYNDAESIKSALRALYGEKPYGETGVKDAVAKRNISMAEMKALTDIVTLGEILQDARAISFELETGI